MDAPDYQPLPFFSTDDDDEVDYAAQMAARSDLLMPKESEAPVAEEGPDAEIIPFIAAAEEEASEGDDAPVGEDGAGDDA